MAVGDLGSPLLIEETVLTGIAMPAGGTPFTAGFAHATEDIYFGGYSISSATNSERDIEIFTVRVTDAGVVTAAVLDTISIQVNQTDPRVRCYKLSDGVVAIIHNANNSSYGVRISTYSVASSTGALTLIDGPDTLNANFSRAQGDLRKLSDGIYALSYSEATQFVLMTFNLTDLGVIGSVIQDSGLGTSRPDRPFIFMPGEIGIRTLEVTSQLDLLTFSLEEDGTFDLTAIDDTGTLSEPDEASHVVALNDDTSIGRLVYIGEAAATDDINVTTIDVDTAGNISQRDNRTASAASVRAGSPNLMAIGDDKVVFFGGDTQDSIFVYAVDSDGNLSEHASDTSIGTVKHMRHAHILPLGTSNERIVVGFIDQTSDEFVIWTLTVETGIGIVPVLAELCVFQYRGIQGVATAQDLCFTLCVLEWREKIETGAIVLGVGLYESIAFPLNYIKMKIRLTAILPPNHGVHPLTNAVGHLPDFVDLEEAALLFNQIGISKDKVSLSLPLPAGVRTYEGVIESIAIIHPPGAVYETLILNFEVDWNPSFPKLRAWNDE